MYCILLKRVLLSRRSRKPRALCTYQVLFFRVWGCCGLQRILAVCVSSKHPTWFPAPVCHLAEGWTWKFTLSRLMMCVTWHSDMCQPTLPTSSHRGNKPWSRPCDQRHLWLLGGTYSKSRWTWQSSLSRVMMYILSWSNVLNNMFKVVFQHKLGASLGGHRKSSKSSLCCVSHDTMICVISYFIYHSRGTRPW